MLAEVAPEADGLEPGQALAAARAQYPGLIALEADHEGDEAALDALAAWATRYTPLVAPQVMFSQIMRCSSPQIGQRAW